MRCFSFPRVVAMGSTNSNAASSRTCRWVRRSMPDELTDRSERFLAGEMVREQVMLRLSKELPYAATVEVTQFSEAEGHSVIHATIWIEREGQKAIVIGAGGAQLKAIGSAARRVMEKAFGRRVHLQLWVRVRENWSDDEAALRKFGYSE